MLQNERLSKTLRNNLRQCLRRPRQVVQDLMPVVRQHYAHLAMVNSTGWMLSIKPVLPLLVPRLNRNQLAGVQNSTDAQLACLHVAVPGAVRRKEGYSDKDRQREIGNMLRYCHRYTKGIVVIVRQVLMPIEHL